MLSKNKLLRKLGNIKALLTYFKISRSLKDNNLFFFFPVWQIGGGERVHADILEVCSDIRPVCFLCEKSQNGGFKADFEASSIVIQLGRWSSKLSFRRFILNKIATEINKKTAPVVFGCHTRFYYELIPLLAEHVQVIDLTHAFTFDPEGAENYSLSQVARINKRVILGENTRNDYRNQYANAGLSAEYLNRLVVIPNKAVLPAKTIEKQWNAPLKALFVSRNATEKRPELFVKITQLSYEKNLPVEFFMIGDFEEYRDKVQSNTHILGEIADKTKLSEYYSMAHMILITSWREGFPLVLSEGMSHGVIPIAMAVGEIPYYIDSEIRQNGFLVEDDSDQQVVAGRFLEKISLMLKNRQLQELFSKNAYAMVAENFNELNFNEAYRKLLLK